MPDAEIQEPAVDISRVSFTYPRASTPALDNITLRVAHGERLGILGPNGGGKSTLLKLILGLLTGSEGEIRVFGKSPAQARRAGLIGYVPQKPEIELALPLSAKEVVTLGASWRLAPWQSVSADLRARVDHLIDLVGAAPFASRPVGKLSGGQLQRVFIARALVCRPRILALDEPTVGIDAAGQRTFADLIARLHRELGITVLTVTHDLRAIAAGSDRVACLAGRLHSHMSPKGLTPQVLAELFSHDVAGLSGMLGGVHVHAHAAAEACPLEPAPPSPGCGCDQGGPHAHH